MSQESFHMASIMTKIDDAALNSYLVKHLQPLTEADPNILAKYVVALLKNIKPKKELQAFCIEKLLDFLGEDSNNFVVNLFQALEDGTISTSKDSGDNRITEDSSILMAAAPAKATVTIDNTEPRTSSQFEKDLDLNNTGSSKHEEEVSDDEDDDRNHKHRRRVQRSRSLDRDSEDGPLRKRTRPAFDGQSNYDDGNHTEGAQRGSNSVEKDGLPKRRLGRDNMSGASSRFGGDINQRGVSRGGPLFRNDGTRSRFEHQKGLSRGVLGRGRGASPSSWGAREPRASVLDGLDFSLSMFPPGSLKNLYPGRSSSSLGNAVQSSWPGYNRFAGLTNGMLDQGIPLNTGIQGSRGAPISAPLAVNMNMGVGLGRPRCPDFEERGYCLRGDLCPMEHGANRIVVEDVQSLQKFNLPVTLPSGRGVAQGPVTKFGTPSIVSADTNMASMTDLGVSKGASVINANTEAELYDPDQPLWNKEQSAALADGLRKLPSYRSGTDSGALDSELLAGGKGLTPDKEGYGKSIVMGIRSQGLTGGQSVWNRIGGTDQVDVKGGDSYGFNDLSVGGSQHLKALKREPANAENLLGIDYDQDMQARRSPNTRIDMHSGLKGEVGLHSKGQNISSARSFRPLIERAHKTLFVGSIPSNSNTKELLLAHFRKFGIVVDLRLLPNGEKAFVQFSRHEDAEAALASPEAVMGNRFIRLSWAKRDSIQISSPEDDAGGEGLGSEHGGLQRFGSDNSFITRRKRQLGASSISETIATKSATKSGLNMQSAPSVVPQKKREELEHMKEELRRKQEELAHKRDEFRRKLEQISKQKGKSSESEMEQGSNATEMASKAERKEGQMEDKGVMRETSLNSLSAVGSEKVSSLAEHTPSVLVKETLKQPLVLVPGPSANTFQPSPRSLRSHAPWPSPGFTGSSPWTPSRYKIDNRTSVFRVLPPFPECVLDVPMLKEHFSLFGDVTNVEMDTLDAGKHGMKVTFATRSAAERAFLQGRWYQGQCLNFTWLNPSPPAANTSAAVVSLGVAQVEDVENNVRHLGEEGPEDVQEQRRRAMNGEKKELGLSCGNNSLATLPDVEATSMDNKNSVSYASSVDTEAIMDD